MLYCGCYVSTHKCFWHCINDAEEEENGSERHCMKGSNRRRCDFAEIWEVMGALTAYPSPFVCLRGVGPFPRPRSRRRRYWRGK